MSAGPSKNDDQSTAGGRFKPGNAGGPGRRAGSRNKATLLLDRLGSAAAQEILDVVLQAAKEGDLEAANIILRRVWPVPKGRPRKFTVRDVTCLADVPGAVSDVLRAVASGELTTEEGGAVASIIETTRKALESEEVAARLKRLEDRIGAQKR